jgi:hypothetical protein
VVYFPAALQGKLVVQGVFHHLQPPVNPLRQIHSIVEHVVTYARSAHLSVVLGNVSTLSPTPQIVDCVAMYALMSLAPSVFVSMGVDEFHDLGIHNFITNNSKTQRIPSLPKGLFTLGAFNAK